MTTDEIIAYQAALYVVASEAAEKVRRRKGTPREIVEAFDVAVQLCGWPEPRVRTDDLSEVAAASEVAMRGSGVL